MKELIESVGWPHVVFLFAIILILVFRKQFAALISRVTSIDKTGIKTGPIPEAQREEKKSEAVQELLLAIGDSITLRDVESHIRTELKGRGLEVEGDTIKVLIKYLAASRILLEFEQIHNLIFGSQIFLLKKMNETVGQGAGKDFITAHYNHVKGIFKELNEWTLDQYLEFLIVRLLITVKGEKYHITNLGVEYLTWMARNGRSENKPL
jgi:hypothetical protein